MNLTPVTIILSGHIMKHGPSTFINPNNLVLTATNFDMSFCMCAHALASNQLYFGNTKKTNRSGKATGFTTGTGLFSCCQHQSCQACLA